MSIYSTTVNCTYHDSKHLSEGTIDKKEDYSCIPCWETAKFNEGTSVHRFWKFYQLAFPSAFQANSVTRQAFTQLVSTVLKEAPTAEDENLAERLSLKLVESIRYQYSPEKPVIETVRVIREVIKETTRFAEGSTPHAILTEIKRRDNKDRASTSLFGSFIGRISKGKGYAQVDDPRKVDNPDQTFKVFEGGAFDEEIYTLEDTSDILGSLSGRESPELTRVSRVTRDYNLRSRSQSPQATRTSLPTVRRRKVPKLVVLLPLPPPITPIVPVVPMNRPPTPDGNAQQTVINTMAWMHTNAKEGTYARLSEYHGKSGEDVMAWCEEVDRVAAANNWRDSRIHTIVAAYLRGAAADYYEEERVNINGWTGGNAANNLRDLLIVRFASDSTKDVWYGDYLNCRQGITESVEEYGNRFKRLQKKVDPNNGTLAANTIRQFLSGLNPTIASIVYASTPRDLNAAVDAAKSIEAGYKITQRNVQQQSNYALQQLAPQKDSMEVLTATIEKLLRQKEEEKYPTTRPGGSINVRCWRCNEIGHFQKDCMSERFQQNYGRGPQRNFNSNNNYRRRGRGRNQRYQGRNEVNFTRRESNKTYYADNPNSRDMIIQQKLYHVNMANLAVRTTVRVKGTPMRAVLDTGANVSIITLPVVKKLRLTLGMPNGSKIIAVDQTKKNVVGIVRDV